MMKFAFLLIEPGQSPENYSGTYENKESFNLVAGFDALEDVKEYAGKLAEEGYNLINLCGEFDDEYTAQIQEITGPDVKVYHADYTPEELVKIGSRFDNQQIRRYYSYERRRRSGGGCTQQ